MPSTRTQISQRVEELRRTLDLDYGSGERAPREVVEGYLLPSRADGWDEALLRLFRNFETPRCGPRGRWQWRGPPCAGCAGLC